MDLIERQAAIDNLKRHLNETDVPDHYPGIFNAIEEWLSDWEVPSAQPEIIHCKDCKFTDGKRPIADGRYWCVLHPGFMDFCSDAERRTDG